MTKARRDPKAQTSRRSTALDQLPIERLRTELEELGLSSYEARVLLALLQLGNANTLDLARVSGVPRTSIYQVLEGLRSKRLAARAYRDGPAVWGAASAEDIIVRLEAELEAAHHERLRDHQARAAEVKRLLHQASPRTASSGTLTCVHLLHGAAQTKQVYDELWKKARSEVLVMNRRPYASVSLDPLILAALARNVRSKALYEQAAFNAPAADEWRQSIAAYHDAGVEGRMVQEVPVKLAIFDHQDALVALSEDEQEPLSAVFPTVLHIEHAGYAKVQAAAFEQMWSTGQPVPDLDVSGGSSADG